MEQLGGPPKISELVSELNLKSGLSECMILSNLREYTSYKQESRILVQICYTVEPKPDTKMLILHGLLSGIFCSLLLL